MTVNTKMCDSYKSWGVRAKDYGKERKSCSSYAGRGAGEMDRALEAFIRTPCGSSRMLISLNLGAVENWSGALECMWNIRAYQRKDYFLIFGGGTPKNKQTKYLLFIFKLMQIFRKLYSEGPFLLFYSWHFNMPNSHCRRLFQGGTCC